MLIHLVSILHLSKAQVMGKLVMNEYLSSKQLSPLTSYSKLLVSQWTIPSETKSATWSLQSSTGSEHCQHVNITM